MENFDFNNIEEYLRKGGDPETIANAFAKNLNSVLAILEDESSLKEATSDLKKAWDNYVDVYFDRHSLPANTSIKDWYMEEEEVENIFSAIINVTPYLDKWMSLLDKSMNFISDTENKIKNSSFDSVVNNFFNKNGIK